MNKVLLTVLGLLFLLPGLAQEFSYKFAGQKLTYTVVNKYDKTCQPKAGSSSHAGNNVSGDLIIPEKVKYGDTEYTVISIPRYAFCYGDIKSVIIPNTVVTIENNAFSGNYDLTGIVLPESLKYIGDECFRNCPLATVISSGKNIERIGRFAFDKLSQFEVGDKLQFLGEMAFGDNLKVLKINGKTPPKLGKALLGFTEDEAYNILVIVPIDGDDKYRNDEKWNGFHIVEANPMKTVYMTGKYPLSEEITTTTQQMPGEVASLAIVGELSRSDWDIIKNNLVSCYDLDLSRVTNTIIPDELFKENTHLLRLKLPNQLRQIGDYAFEYCINLAIDNLPETLEVIGNGAFYNCNMLNLSSLPNTLKTIGSAAFDSCDRLNITKLPAIESLGRFAFSNCGRLFELDMSDVKIATIEEGTFYDCKHLRNVILPKTVTNINGDNSDDYGAFQNTAINFISFPETLRTIGGAAFNNTPMISVVFPKQLNYLGEYSFAECQFLKTITFSSGIKEIMEGAFQDCRGIQSISVPCVNPPKLGEYVFYNIRYRDVVVSIPTLNYREYLNAIKWGMFTQLSNSIFLDYQELNENGNQITQDEAEENNIEVGVIENGSYEELLETVESEEKQAAADKARDEAIYGKNNMTTIEIAENISQARKKAGAKAEVILDAKARQAFSHLFSGQSMTIGDNSGYRVKIQPKEGVEIVKIEFDGKDITNSYIDNMVTLPALSSKSNLKIYRNASIGSVDKVSGYDKNATADVYNFQGIVILRDVSESQVSRLNPGMYIYKGRKIIIR